MDQIVIEQGRETCELAHSLTDSEGVQTRAQDLQKAWDKNGCLPKSKKTKNVLN
jgi:hypothetical protein